MLRFLTAGESHGKALTAIIEGLPAGLPLDKEYIDKDLRKRQGGYGRGQRMQIEKDSIQFLSGIRNGETIGSPLAIVLENKDWDNWLDIMKPEKGAKVQEKVVSKPRPGHADLAGALKYRHRDMRNILERASARETAIRTAVGSVAKSFLKYFGIEIYGHVFSIGEIKSQVNYKKLNEDLYKTPLYCTDEKATEKMIKLIDEYKEKGDSLGGVIEVVAYHVPVGLGSHVHWDRRLDGKLAQALMSIPAVKGVEVGVGFQGTESPGSLIHDEIFYSEAQGFFHKTNRCGGIEGGISNGEEILLRAAVKPIPTLYSPLQSVDLLSKEINFASVERSDNCAVSAAAVVGEAVVAWELASCFVEKFSGDSIKDIAESFTRYKDNLKKV